MNPEHRLTISAILERLAAIAETNSYNLRAPLEVLLQNEIESDNVPQADTNHVNRAPPRPSQPSPAHQPPPRPAPPPSQPPPRPGMPPPHQRMPDGKHASSGLFSSIKGGAGSFLKNLKDTSSKVMQTMQQ